jgi:hypothetical protein
MGESYAAVTWSGDIGASATGMVRHDYQDWEDAALFGRGEDETIRLYLSMSAPDFDLLADVDSWGAADFVPVPGRAPPPLGVESLVGLVTRAYGPAGGPSTAHTFARSANRSNGIRKILTHYGFTSATGLLSQGQAVARMGEQVLIIAKTFFQVQAARAILGGGLSEGLPQPTAQEELALTDASAKMTPLFVTWLQGLVTQYGVTL